MVKTRFSPHAFDEGEELFADKKRPCLLLPMEETEVDGKLYPLAHRLGSRYLARFRSAWSVSSVSPFSLTGVRPLTQHRKSFPTQCTAVRAAEKHYYRK